VNVQGWIHSFGGEANDKFFGAESQRNEVYLVGESSTGGGMDNDTDGLLASYTGDGEPRWQRSWGESTDDSFRDVAAIYGGGFIAVGQTSGFGADATAMVVARFDSFGNEVWARTWDTPGSDLAKSVSLDFGGNAWVTGTSDGLQVGDDLDGVVLKYSPDGDLLVEKSVTGGGSTVCSAIEASLFDGIFIVGSSEAYSLFPVAAVWNLDENGTLSNDIALDTLYETAALDLEVSAGGGVYICGTYDNGTSQALVALVNSDAEFAWVTGWDYGDFAVGRGIRIRYGGFLNVTDVYVGGDTYDQLEQSVISYLIRLDPDGTYTDAYSWLASSGPISYALGYGKAGSILLAGQGEKAAAVQSTLAGAPEIFFIVDTYEGTTSVQDVNATKSDVSSASVPLAGLHDTGGGNADAWIGSFIPEDL
jgi:hypothetical protein